MVQKIRSDAATSYSILGLSILLGLCALLIIISVTIEPFTGWVGKKLGKGNYEQLEWMSNNTLQLQRFAHEELGCGSWTGENIPITIVGETLAVLDISEPGHPMLVNPALAHASMALVNASSLLMDTHPPPADIYSAISDASTNASSPLMNASPQAENFPPIEDGSSPIVDASSPLMEEVSASASASLKDTSSQQSSNATMINTRH